MSKKQKTKNNYLPKTIAVALVLFLFAMALPTNKYQQVTQDAPSRYFHTQADFVEDLRNTDINLEDPLDVFRHIFQRMQEEVTIYQSENNLYLKFAAKGKVYGGIITLAILTRDEGIISLSYIERNENPNVPMNREGFLGGGKSFTKEDGVIVTKIDDWTYDTTFEGKTVRFHLYNPGMQPPQKIQLLPEEEYVGPVFDEAVIELYLVYNNNASKLYLLLNEDRYVSETFKEIGNNLLLGERTGFVFYEDKETNRKILIGVQGENTIQNNWYDGPHDQMPDNYVHYGYIPKYQGYLEAAYPYYKGKIDKYGHFKEKDTGRIAVAPYTIYFYQEELQEISTTCQNYAQTKTELYECLTVQTYNIPEEKEYLLGY